MDEVDKGDVLVLPQTFTVARIITAVDTATNRLTVASHGWSVNHQLTFENSGGSVPGGAALETTYYVKTVPDANTVELSATEGGAILDITNSGSGINYLRGPADPTAITLKIKKPGIAVATYNWPTPADITKLSLGNFQYSLTADVSGTWRYKWTGTGAAAGAAVGSVYVRADDF